MEKYQLKLYITGHTSRSEKAIADLHRLCSGKLEGQCELKIIDVLASPQAVEKDNIVATPTLIKELPAPIRRIIGDLSQKEKVLRVLEIKPAEST